MEKKIYIYEAYIITGIYKILHCNYAILFWIEFLDNKGRLYGLEFI